MRSVTHQDPAALQLLKTFLEALSSPGKEGVSSNAQAPVEHKGAQPPPPAPPTRTPPGSPARLDRPASLAAEAVAAQMLARVMADGAAASGAMLETSRDSDGRKDSGASDARPEGQAQTPANPATANGSIPWPNQALAAYSARPRELIELQPGGPSARARSSGGSDLDAPTASTLKLFRRTLLCTCVIALLFVLLNREALFG